MARTFNNSNQYLYNASAPVTSYPISMACWFYRLSSSSIDWLMGSYSSPTETISGHNLYLDTDPSVIWANSQSGSAFAWGGYTVVANNQWNHAAGVSSNATTRKAYYNGSSSFQQTTSITPTGIAQTRIGVYDVGTAQAYPMHGYIAEAAIWNAALTDAEVAILAKGYSPLLVRPGNLAAYWPLIGRTSPEIDLVGGYNMTLANTPGVAAHPRVLRPVSLWVPSLTATPAPPSGGTIPVIRWHLQQQGIG